MKIASRTSSADFHYRSDDDKTTSNKFWGKKTGGMNLGAKQYCDCFGLKDGPPKKIKGFRIARVEIATVAYGSFAMTLLVHFLMHTS